MLIAMQISKQPPCIFLRWHKVVIWLADLVGITDNNDHEHKVFNPKSMMIKNDVLR